ncbi:hypothetical protein [Sunxiuqinia indica]|uniref:hypothetical protein n=1 Tax=Sunxiuqinia indica TaxID=2692584 RepID=UPI001914DE76|nr:hypothetical protein [Sunxiuqinia indica]
MYETLNETATVEELNWYYGFGGHIGFWDGNRVNWADDNNAYTVIGIDGILGLEYHFARAPHLYQCRLEANLQRDREF